MNIYIPKHIRRIEVVSKMCELIELYSSNPDLYLDPTASFNDYYYYLNTDPVNRFLHICIPESTWNENDQHSTEDYESCISYLSRLFYSVKGTYQVLEYMKSYLGLEFTECVYTVKTLKLTIKEVTLTEIDEKIYYDALVDFLSALLYFGEVEIRIELIKLHLGNSLHNYTGACIVTYKEYTTVRYNENG